MVSAASMLHRGIGAGQRDLDEAAHLFQFFFLDPLEGVEVLHFAGDFAVEIRWIKMRDGADTTDPGQEVLPRFVCADSQCADQPNSRNNHPASHGFPAPIWVSEFVLQTLSEEKSRVCHDSNSPRR